MTGTRSGSSDRHKEAWRAAYQKTPYQELPWYDPDPSPQVVRAVRERFLPSKGRVLDIGCGAGSNVLYLARQGLESHGIDLSPEAVRSAIERARKERLEVDVQVGDALALDFEDAQFDGLVDNGCFHTLPVRRRREYAQEVARVLRPGGAFVLAWVGRENTGPRGPPHRPSLEEVTQALEREFLFEQTIFHPGEATRGLAIYEAFLRRRADPQPPPM